MNCIICSGPNTEEQDFLVEDKFPLVECADCGLIFIDFLGQDADFEVEEYWDASNRTIYSSPEVVSELRKKYTKYLGMIGAPAGRTLLDVGSGAGVCVDTAAKIDFDARGVEPSTDGVQMSRDTFSINVTCALLEKGDDLPTNFDVLTLWDVIEHVVDPRDLVETCAEHTTSGGFFILETPRADAWIRSFVSLLSRFVPGLELRNQIYYTSHRFYFSAKSITKLLALCGYEDIRVHNERSMYKKALLKAQVIHGKRGIRLSLMKASYFLLSIVPFTQNKMVVVARKA